MHSGMTGDARVVASLHAVEVAVDGGEIRRREGRGLGVMSVGGYRRSCRRKTIELSWRRPKQDVVGRDAESEDRRGNLERWNR